MKPTLARDLALDALLMASPQEGGGDPLRSGHAVWQCFCAEHGLLFNMRRHGNYWNNLMAETFLSKLKKERI